jgi:hypothetical protein
MGTVCCMFRKLELSSSGQQTNQQIGYTKTLRLNIEVLAIKPACLDCHQVRKIIP